MFQKLEKRFNTSFVVSLVTCYFTATSSLSIIFGVGIMSAFASSEGDSFDFTDFLLWDGIAVIIYFVYLATMVLHLVNTLKVYSYFKKYVPPFPIKHNADIKTIVSIVFFIIHTFSLVAASLWLLAIVDI